MKTQSPKAKSASLRPQTRVAKQVSPVRAPRQIPTPVATEKPVPPVLVFPGAAQLRSLQSGSGLLTRLWNWIRTRHGALSRTNGLRVTATASLGEKRMVAVVEVDGHQFLVGSGPTTVTLLAQLTSDEPFSNLLKETMAAPSKQPVKRQAAKPTVARIRKQA